MAGAHSKIIAAAAKAELSPLGFRRPGQSRLWIADRGFWLNIVEFTPSQWSVSVTLDNCAHWLWAGKGYLSLNFSLPGTAHAEFVSEQQFADEVAIIAASAASRARQIDAMFPSIDAIAAHIIAQADGCERARSSWTGYYAAVVAGLMGDFDRATYFLRAISVEIVKSEAGPLLEVMGRPVKFRAHINNRVAAQRAALKLQPLEKLPF